MGTYRIIDIAREYLFGGAAFLRTHPKSWLLYDPPQEDVHEAMSTMTLTSPAVSRKGLNPKTANQPMAIEIVKGNMPERFPLGITVGRTEESDLVLADDSISRLHSYFQEKDGGLLLWDANSKNGTSIDGKRVEPLKPEPLPEEALLRFGFLEVRFLKPERFVAYLEKLSKAGLG